MIPPPQIKTTESASLRSKQLAEIEKDSLIDMVPGLRDLILESGEIRVALAGEYIIREGESASHLIIPINENIRLLWKSSPQKTSFLQSKRALGLREILEKAPYAYSAIAEKGVKYVALSSHDFLRLLSKQPTVTNYLSLITKNSGARTFKNFLSENEVSREKIIECLGRYPTTPLTLSANENARIDPEHLVLVRSGDLEIIRQDGTPPISVHEGAWFGGESIVPPYRRSYECRALSSASLDLLPIRELRNILVDPRCIEAIYEDPWTRISTKVNPLVRSGNLILSPLRGAQSIDCNSIQKKFPSLNLSDLRTFNDAESAFAGTLTYLCSWNGIEIDESRFIPALIAITKKTPLRIAEILEPLGLRCNSWKISLEALQNSTRPIWLQIHGHPIIFLGSHNSSAIAYSPLNGLISIPNETLRESWDGMVLEAWPDETHENELDEKTSTTPARRVLQLIIGMTRERVELLRTIFFSSALITALLAVIPWLSQLLIDEVLTLHDRKSLTSVILGMSLALLATAVIRIQEQTLLYKYTQSVGFDFLSRVYRAALKHAQKIFSQDPVGEVFTRLAACEEAKDFVVKHLLSLVTDSFTVVVFSIMIGITHPYILLLTFSLVVLMAIIRWWVGRKMNANYRRVFKAKTRFSSLLAEQISGIVSLKSCSAENAAANKLERTALIGQEALRKAKHSASTLNGASSLLTQSIETGGVLIAAFYALTNQVSGGEIFSVSLYLGILVPALSRLASLMTEYDELRTSLEKIHDLIYAKPLHESTHSGHHIDLKGKIRIERASFRYTSEGPWVINNLNLTIYPHQVVAVVGRSGCGKTTLANLLSGDIRPSSGKVFLDGVDSQLIDKLCLKRQIGHVMQTNHLFSGPVWESVAYGEDSLELEAMEDAIALSQSSEFINRIPKRLNHILGEGGIGLSGGQKQRLVLARVLYQNPKILILDEATAALDSETERSLFEALRETIRNRTCIIIAHRLSTIRRADRILVMQNGAIVEDGNHAELIARGGHYAELFAGAV